MTVLGQNGEKIKNYRLNKIKNINETKALLTFIINY